MSFRLKTHGGLAVCDETGQDLHLPMKGVICVAYLHFERRAISRRELAGLLWPNASTDAAFTNLRSTVSRVQGVLEGRPPIFIATPTHLELVDGAISADFDSFQRAEICASKFEDMVDMLRRPFLHTVWDALSPALRHWAASVEVSFQSTCRDTLLAHEVGSHDEHAKRLTVDAALLLLERMPNDDDVRHLLGATAPEMPRVSLQREQPQEDDRIDVPAHAPRLALLPPEGERGTELFDVATGLIEDVTIALCAAQTIAVVAPYTSEQIRRSADKAQILQRHTISYVLDCRASIRGLYAQLVFLPTDEVIWAERFPLQTGDLVHVRNEIAAKCLSAITARICANVKRDEDFQAHPDAYRIYLLGLQGLSDLQLPAIRRSRKLFRQALSVHSGIAVANSALSHTHSLEWLLTTRGDTEMLRRAVHFAEMAIRQDPLIAAGHRELGVARLYLGDVDGSISSLSYAESLSPNHADGLYSFGDTLVHASRPADALIKLETALTLSPLAPDAYHWSAAGACYFLERFEDALSHVDNMRDKTAADRIAAASHAMLGNRERARFLRRRSMTGNPTFDVEAWTAMIPFKEPWQTALYRDGLKRAGFLKRG